MVWVFVNGLGDQGSIPGQVILNAQKMVLDASLLNNTHCKVWIKGKVVQSRKKELRTPQHLVVVVIEKGAFRLPSTRVNQLTYGCFCDFYHILFLAFKITSLFWVTIFMTCWDLIFALVIIEKSYLFNCCLQDISLTLIKYESHMFVKQIQYKKRS